MHEAELLFTEVLKCSRSSLYLNKDLILSREQTGTISAVLKKRMLGYPLQYILGKTEFMGLGFKITPEVLIPRQETEILVETAVKLVNARRRGRFSGMRILDMGTGSGCIAIAMAKLLPGAAIDAADISEEALAVARENARRNDADVNFIKSDLFDSGELDLKDYELIVSNPPYVSQGQFSSLQPEIRYEPRHALDGGLDGLDFYRRIIEGSARFLIQGGFLVMEIGFGQRTAIGKIIRGSKEFSIKEVVRDYSGIDRVITAQRHNG